MARGAGRDRVGPRHPAAHAPSAPPGAFPCPGAGVGAAGPPDLRRRSGRSGPLGRGSRAVGRPHPRLPPGGHCAQGSEHPARPAARSGRGSRHTLASRPAGTVRRVPRTLPAQRHDPAESGTPATDLPAWRFICAQFCTQGPPGGSGVRRGPGQAGGTRPLRRAPLHAPAEASPAARARRGERSAQAGSAAAGSAQTPRTCLMWRRIRASAPSASRAVIRSSSSACSWKEARTDASSGSPRRP